MATWVDTQITCYGKCIIYVLYFFQSFFHPTSCTINTRKGNEVALISSRFLVFEPTGLPRLDLDLDLEVVMVVDFVDDVSFVPISFKMITRNGFEQTFFILYGAWSENTSITFPDFKPSEFGVSVSSMTFPLTLKSNEPVSLQIFGVKRWNKNVCEVAHALIDHEEKKLRTCSA